MDRIITYHITEQDAGLRIEQYLRRRGYSRQNLVELKKMPESILVNGVWYYLTQTLSAGDFVKSPYSGNGVFRKDPAHQVASYYRL